MYRTQILEVAEVPRIFLVVFILYIINPITKVGEVDRVQLGGRTICDLRLPFIRKRVFPGLGNSSSMAMAKKLTLFNRMATLFVDYVYP